MAFAAIVYTETLTAQRSVNQVHADIVGRNIIPFCMATQAEGKQKREMEIVHLSVRMKWTHLIA